MSKKLLRIYSFFVSIALFTNLLFPTSVLAETIVNYQGEKETHIGGIISNDTVLTLENSPYILTQDIQIAYGVTLSIEEGVVIQGNNNSIKTWGKLSAIGTSENKITFEDVNIGLNGNSSEPGYFDIQYANIYGGSISKAGGNSKYGSFNIRDSYIKDTNNYMYIWYPTSDINIERNIFENSEGISIGTDKSINVFIRNNVFYNQKGGFAVKNWASYNSSKTIVEYNSFLSNDRTALRIEPGYNSAKMIAKNNYWNTEDEKIIENMILDKKDDLSSASIVEKEPILLEPHENTPKVDFSELILSLTEPESGEEYFEVDKDVVIRFNKKIQVGDLFNQITVKDNIGNNIEVSKEIEGNTLVLKPNSPLDFNTRYLVEIPSTSIKDTIGNNLVKDYSFQFKTINEEAVTPIGGIISSDTTLEVDKSPYILTEDIQIAYGSIFNIEPGVVIKGNDYNIKTLGKLNAIGSEDNRIIFEGVNIGINGTSAENALIDIQYSDIYGGSLMAAGGNAEYGSFNLRDSYIKDTKKYMYVWYPTSDVNIERNIFNNSGGISVGTDDNVNVTIRNNVFYRQTSDFAIKNWASYKNSKTIVEYNSFLSNDRIAVKLPKGYTSAKLTAINNYWNTDDSSIIDEMVFDKNDDLGSAGIIETSPRLSVPHENTPKVDFNELTIVESNPTNEEINVKINKNIEVKFNKNVEVGDSFEEIKLTNKFGNNIEILKEVEENTLKITPKSLLEMGTSYYLTVPIGAVIDLYGNNLSSDYNISFKTKDETVTTEIGGIISEDTTLTVDNSPYSLTKDIQIAYGTTLKVEPGVMIKGNNNSIKTWGVLSAIGTDKEKIFFENVNIAQEGISTENSLIDIKYSDINGGSLMAPGGSAGYGSFNLRDSYIKDTKKYIYIWYPTADVNIERNIFDNAGGISVGTSGDVKVAIRNNVFYKQTSAFAIENWASYDSSETIVEYNSFMSTDRIALRLPSGYSNAKMTAINNYWNTEDTSVIDNMIFDKNDDLGSSGEVGNPRDLIMPVLLVKEQEDNYISYKPFLNSKHINTPIFNYENPILSYLDLEYVEDKVMVDKNISIKFNKDILKGDNFDNVVLKDENKEVVRANITINKNELLIEPMEYLYYDQEYSIEIPNDAIIDERGNYMESKYSYEFITEEPRFDLDNSSEIDILDIAMLSSNYNMSSENKNWNSLYDFNGDKIIDIFDLVMISRKIN